MRKGRSSSRFNVTPIFQVNEVAVDSLFKEVFESNTFIWLSNECIKNIEFVFPCSIPEKHRINLIRVQNAFCIRFKVFNFRYERVYEQHHSFPCDFNEY